MARIKLTSWGSWQDPSDRWRQHRCWVGRSRRWRGSAEQEILTQPETTFFLQNFEIYKNSFSRWIFLDAVFNLSLRPKLGNHLQQKLVKPDEIIFGLYNTSWRARCCPWKKNVTKILNFFFEKTLPGHTWVSTKNFSPTGLAV